MNESKKKIGLNNGWILCPSKSFPGKFYYFNVLNGEAAWSLNEADNKGLRKDSSIHEIADKSHNYPEPTTLPDETSITAHKIGTNCKKPDFLRNIPCTQLLPTFGQAAFPKHVANVDPLMPNIVWASVPVPMFCPETKKPMFDKVTQISEFERDLFMQSSDIPLCKRFKNYEKPVLSFDKRNKIVKKPLSKFETSTPKNLFLDCIESQNCFPKSKPLIKESVLKLETMLPNSKIPDIKSNEKPTISLSNKVESTKSSMELPKVVKKDEILENLDRTDLRFLLLAKRKSVDATIDAAVERKKPKPSEIEHATLKKKVTFNLNNETDDSDMSEVMTEDFIPLTPNISRTDTPKTPVLHPKDNTPPCIKDNYIDTPKATLHVQEAGVPTVRNKTWYIVVDTDVLLLDYELIDKLVLSDPKCKLVIPHAVAADIEALCLGDCRGQQRVIKARQLTRKLATPPPQYIVEPPSLDNGSIVVTTESILNCCMKAVNKNCYVVLITNDPHLQIRANMLNIPSYKLNDVKYGVNIKPVTSEHRQIQINTSNDTDRKPQFIQSKSNCLFGDLVKIKPEMTSELKNLKIDTPNDDTDRRNQFNDNKFKSSLFSNLSSINTVKKQLFSNSDNKIDNRLIDCDKLINITKPKCLKNVDNSTKYDSDSSTSSDISREVQYLNLRDKNVLETHNVSRNPFLLQNERNRQTEDGNVKFEKIIPNSLFNTYNFGNAIPNSKRETLFETPKVPQLNHEINNFPKESLERNLDKTEKLFCSIPISNLKQFQSSDSKLNVENSGKLLDTKVLDTCIPLRHESCGANRENKLLNPSQTRIKKIFSSINNDSTRNTQLENQVTKDSTGLFKIPQPFKNRTRNTSVHIESSTVSEKIRTRVDIDSIDENLKRFCVKSKAMREKIKTRIDEWICSYMQIMEDVLINLLQKNSVCMKNTVAPLSFRDILNCIKMLYDNQTKIRDVVDRLTELLERCIVCVQGKFKMSVEPEDFMKIFGCGVLLIIALKIILPHSKELKEAELRLSALQSNIESNTKELDPESVKSPSVSRTDVDVKDEEIRPQFFKKTSYIIDYLKKHFKEWASYKEDSDEGANHKIHDHSDIKVVRTLGKNLNLLKIDRRKTMSLSKSTTEDDLANKSKDGPKLIRLLENNQLNKPDNNENVEIIVNNETGPELKGKNGNFIQDNEVTTDQKNNVAEMTKPNDNIKQDQNNHTKATEEFSFPTHGNTFLDNEEMDGPKIIRNIKLIDEFEKKIKNREPLDLDQLDYSEIYEPSVFENLEFDIISEKKINSETNNNSENNNNYYGLPSTMSILDDFYISPSLSSESKTNNTFNSKNNIIENSNNNISDNNNSKNNNSYFKSVSNNNNVINSNNEVKNGNINCRDESETYTENVESHNDSCFGNDNSETNIDNSETHNYDSGTHINISETHIDNSETAQIIRDDNTNDSGFENDSTYAHSTVKIFLNELSTSFKVIYKFVTKFVDEIRERELSDIRKDVLHNQASKSLEDMVAIIMRLRSIIKRESAEETVLKTLLRNAGVEATADKRMTRYRQIVIKCLEQALILESALKIIVSTTIGDFEALSTNAETINSSIRYFNIFE